MDNIKTNRYYLDKIINDLTFVAEHMDGISYDAFCMNEILVDSMMFRLIQISENSGKLSEDFKKAYSNIPWRAMKGLRNRIVHEYGNVDLEIIYETVAEDVPNLLETLSDLFNK